MNKLHTWTISIDEFLEMDPDDPIFKEHIVGFFITQRKTNIRLTIYLVSKVENEYEVIDYFDIYKAYQLFLVTTDNVFENPPLKYWLDSKKEWCHKVALQISKKFSISIDDALSDIYFTIIKCYNKKTVYLGSLEYLRKSAVSMQLMKYRNKKHENNILSLNTPIDEDNELELADTIGYEDEEFDKLEYKCLKEKAIKMLEKNFSSREIDQILKLQPSMLPANLLQRLYLWRNKHKKEELYDDIRRTDNGSSERRLF